MAHFPNTLSHVVYICTMNETFGKEYKLCSEKIIQELFVSGKKLHSFPFSIQYEIRTVPTKVPFQITLSVPKRSFKKAHDRNRIKRLIRECIRKNKLILEEPLNASGKQLALFLIYKHNSELDYTTLMHKTRKIFLLLNETIQQHEA